MRILVVGAGGIGGYFGGRLLAAGRDVTFLVRERRAGQLASDGLIVDSKAGSLHLPSPPTVTADRLKEPFDLVLLSCKAYDLDGAMESVAPAVGPNTAILPLLNGMAHLDRLDARFGADRVLGGKCLISVELDEEGRIKHLGTGHSVSFGERAGGRSARGDAIAAALSYAGFDLQYSQTILQDMWEKWVLIATGAGICCLMRGAIGDIVAAGAADLCVALLNECAAVAAAAGFPPSAALLNGVRSMVTLPGSGQTSSMFRDMERRGRIEADQIIGDLVRRGGDHLPAGALMRIVLAHLKSYEARRAREDAVA